MNALQLVKFSVKRTVMQMNRLITPEVLLAIGYYIIIDDDSLVLLIF